MREVKSFPPIHPGHLVLEAAVCGSNRRTEYLLPEPNTALHTTTAEVGYGDTLKERDLRPEVPGMWTDQVVWNWKDMEK